MTILVLRIHCNYDPVYYIISTYYRIVAVKGESGNYLTLTVYTGLCPSSAESVTDKDTESLTRHMRPSPRKSRPATSPENK